MALSKIKFSAIILAVLTLTACSDDNEIIFEHGATGPNTEAQLERLPEGLIKDQQNSQHSDSTEAPAL